MGCHALFLTFLPSSSRGSSWPGDRTPSPGIAGRFFTTEPPGKPLKYPLFEYQLYITVDTTLIQANICWFHYKIVICLLQSECYSAPCLSFSKHGIRITLPQWKLVGHRHTTCLKCWNDFPILGLERISLVWSVRTCLMFQPHFVPLCLRLHFFSLRLIYLSIYFWLHCAFIAAQAFSSCRKWGLLSIAVHWFLMWWLLLRRQALGLAGFSSCGLRTPEPIQ